MTATPPRSVLVTQADREAAADLIERYWRDMDEEGARMHKLAASYRAGHSQGVWVEAFARYRLAAAPVPPGFVLVPEVPTEAMMAACHTEHLRQLLDGPGDAFDHSKFWSAMLTAAPIPTTSQADVAGEAVRG
jgi:hypothetical protein